MDVRAHSLSSGDFDLDGGLGEESDNQALRSLIESEIHARGPVPFRRFMELALYHSVEGYYCSRLLPVGRTGDYVTSPEVSPLFGYALARQIAQLWHILGAPKPFSLLEYGAGSGRLAQDIMRWLANRELTCFEALSFTLAEMSPPLRDLIAERFRSEIASGKMRASSGADETDTYQCVLANELIDSFPVHRVQVTQGNLREVFVDYRGGRLVEVLEEISTPEIGRYFSRLGFEPAEGCVVEVNLEMQSWLAEAAKLIGAGFLLLLDYGYPAGRLFARWRRDGTLLCYHRHSATSDPYEFVGRQDITCHVDFTTLEEQAREQGLSLLGSTDQSRFLSALGVSNAATRIEADEVQNYFARRRAIETLTDPAGLGRIGVLLFGKNAPSCEPLGFQSTMALR